ncbi:Acylphosphatase [Pyrenophora tritici-repentis]|uniref:acylphosphatase n=1 Tax=Pyrenophora tritici-repentis TaxID=45151 RepID=A0A922SYK9_9PLEO|nr:Acylphosphatase [Pyrenophora tritici-repentis]KAI0611958.1 Acylphosphatase [Pyrenophora tritici-repentis]KAI0624126.1 Acylphosphatase [Pyrenophora tritici-repentis]KAI1517574.1 Acylphosphatase [Pyrenophora tritici-repentis]KAI1673381.1 Acylphosphatase [Pyrenophora tritici-repentis]
MSAKRIQYKVEGRVQGVNFRSFTQKQARSIGITGFVTNASDGSDSLFSYKGVRQSNLESATDTGISQVQGEAQGSEDKINEFVQHLNKGPPAASVSKVDQSDISAKSGESSFNVQ